MEGKHLRVLVTMFRSGSSTSDFHKITKDSHCSFEADSNQNSQGHIDFSIAESRLDYKSTEICSGALAKEKVSRVGNRLSENDINTTIGKSKKNETEMPKAYFKPQNDTMGSDQPCRFSLLDSDTSYTAN